MSVWLRRLDLNPGAMHALISAGSCVKQFTVEAAVFQTAAAAPNCFDNKRQLMYGVRWRVLPPKPTIKSPRRR
jgi:hypothetical protein